MSYAIRHALEALGDAGYDEDIRRAALAELDDLEGEVATLTRDRDRAVAALEQIEDIIHKARYAAPRRAMTTGGLSDEAFQDDPTGADPGIPSTGQEWRDR